MERRTWCPLPWLCVLCVRARGCVCVLEKGVGWSNDGGEVNGGAAMFPVSLATQWGFGV